MSINLSSLSSTVRTKLENITYTDGINQEEAEAAGLTSAELKEIQDAGIAVDDNIKLDLVEEVEETDAATATAAATENAAVNVDMPAENIDQAATTEFKAQIQKAREEYDTAKAEADERAKEIDEKEEEFESLQAEMKKAVESYEDAAVSAGEDANIQVNKLRQQAKDEGWTEAELKQKLGQVDVPSLSGEKRTLESIGVDVENMAGVITELSDLYASQADTVDSLAEQWGGFLQVDLDTLYVNTSGVVVVNEIGSGGPDISGADGISALDMQKFANMTNEQLTQYLDGEEGAAIKTAMQGMANEGVDLSSENCAAIIKTMIAEQDKSTGDAAKFGAVKADNIQVNQINGVDSSKLADAVKKVEAPKKEETPEECNCCPPPRDPYVVKVGDVEYVMIQDNGDGQWDTNDILGINDNKDNLFEALKGLESDGDISKLSPEELEKAGIRLVAKQEDGTLAINDTSKDLKLKEGDFIDMTSLANVDNDGDTGTFGKFTVHVDGQDYEGQETFEEMSTLQKLFGAVKNFFTGLGNVVSDIIDKLKMNQEDKQHYAVDIKEEVQESLDEMKVAGDNAVANIMNYMDGVEDRVEKAGDDYEAPKVEEETPEEVNNEEQTTNGDTEELDENGKPKKNTTPKQ